MAAAGKEKEQGMTNKIKIPSKTKKGDPIRSEVCALIFDKMRNGIFARKACEEIGMKQSTLDGWLNDDPALAEAYTRAREALYDWMAEDTLKISDEPVSLTANGSTDSGAVNQRRLQVDTRKWLLSKLAPKRYGERIDHTSSDGSMTPTMPSVIQIVAAKKDDDSAD